MSDPQDEVTARTKESLTRRKQGHIEVCLDSSVDLERDSFADLKLRYNALPELALPEVSTETRFADRTISAPLIISSMTGGVGEEFKRLNSNLAAAAERLRVPLGLGSMKVMVKDEAAAPSFEVRDLAPSVPLIANLGLVSFNYGLTWDHAAEIIERIRPDVFGLHLNALQESIQEGGDTDFRNLTAHLGVPDEYHSIVRGDRVREPVPGRLLPRVELQPDGPEGPVQRRADHASDRPRDTF